MDFVEAEGNSIDEAIGRALARLGVPRDKVEIDILANATRGVLGIGGRKAKVRATVRSALRIEGISPEPALNVAEPAPEVVLPAEPPPSTTAAPAAPPVDRKSLGEGCAIVQQIIDLMGVEARAAACEGKNGPQIGITGDTGGLLIGRRGQTLDALEYLVNRIVGHDDDHPSRISVDSENYRVRRQQGLEDLARRLAERAKRRGKPVTIIPMSPRDRRIVHLALQGDPSLVTRSLGEGYFRKLVIIPGNSRRGKGSSRAKARSEKAPVDLPRTETPEETPENDDQE